MQLATTQSACPHAQSLDGFDPFDLNDPFELYALSRNELPVFYNDEIEHFVLTRYEDIRPVFDNWKLFSSENAQKPLRPLGAKAKQVMTDGGFTAYSGMSARVPPDHTRIRKLVQSCFGPRRFKAIEPEIEKIVDTAIDAFAKDGQVEFNAEFARDVPALVLFKFLGIPDEDVPMVKSWAVSRASLTWGNLTDEEQIPHAENMVRYWNYCLGLVAKRKQVPANDFPGDMVRLQAEGADISDDEIAGVFYSILFAGHETTTTLLNNGLRELLSHPESWKAIYADPSLIPGAIDECLRYSPSIAAWRRTALDDTQIAGVDIPKGSNILLIMASANRDAAKFADPDTFDIKRSDARRHLTFGYGIHACVGQQLAKMEFAITLRALTSRLPDLHLKADQTFEFIRNTSFRVPLALHLEWDASQQK